MVTSCVAVVLCALAVVAVDRLHPLSDEYIQEINLKQNSWKAGRNFRPDTPMSYIKNLLGARRGEKKNLPIMKYDAELIANLPVSFHPSDKWPNCPSLNEIRDQGSCGSCWAFGAVEAMTDRYCIHSNQTLNFHFSAQDLLTCCDNCGSCLGGGLLERAWRYWKDNGIVSGGSYNSSLGCQPYGIAPCKHSEQDPLPPCGEGYYTPQCETSCESGYDSDYQTDKRHGKEVYTLRSNEDDIKAELFKNGPVEASFGVYSDFLHYKHGVYVKLPNATHLGGHAIKILGWGVENGQKYWLAANSWNTYWGDKGFFKILRGVNHCGIENEVVAGIPLILNE
ncbi:cathepsin B-like [Helicoverpa zea]|uniref:cathepsin B-like n=1 Tax=Helicoverpa zea TaxID=7113 RepID=UPI001F57988F|nr:cathepsin B-like [Helicoverpa zea]